MYGIKNNGSGANGLILAYCLKLTIVAYAIVNHEYGFRLPVSLSDLSFVMNAL